MFKGQLELGILDGLHGLPNNVNSHPHTSSSGKLAVVHNGIIENYSSLKKY